MLMATVVLAIVGACFASASRGSSVGFGLSIAIVSLIVPATMFAAVYWLVYLLALGTNALIPVQNTIVTQDENSVHREDTVLPFEEPATVIASAGEEQS